MMHDPRHLLLQQQLLQQQKKQHHENRQQQIPQQLVQHCQQQVQQQGNNDAAAGGIPPGRNAPASRTRTIVARTWEPVEVVGSVRPERRSGAASCVYKNCLFVFGGYGGLTRLGNLYKFDFTTAAWQELQCPRAPSPRESNGAVVLDRQMFIFGGYSGIQWLNDLHAFDLDKEEWLEVPHWGMKPSPRFGYVAAANCLKKSILLFGGYDGTAWLNDMNEFNAKTLEWLPVKQRGLVPSGRSCPASATHEQGLFLFGGYNGVERLSDLFRFDLNTEVWTVVTTHGGLPSKGIPVPGAYCSWSPPPASSSPPVILDSPLSYGSAASAAKSTATRQHRQECGSASRPSSEELPRSDPFSGYSCCCHCRGADTATSTSGCSNRTNAIGGGGSGSSRCALPNCSSASGNSSCCSVSKSGGGPAARYFHAACARDRKLFAFGGYSGHERLNDLHELDLESFEWRCVDGGCSAPSGRSSMVGAIFGDYFVVFGGYNGHTVLNDFYQFSLEPLAAPPSQLLPDLLSLCSPTQLADAAFLVEGRTVLSCRALLACRSEHFRALFFGGLKEANERSCNNPIRIEGIKYEVFVALVEFLHTDFLPRGLPWPFVVDLMVAAQRVCVDRLKLLCIGRLRATMTPESAVGVLLAAEQLQIEPLKDCALDFLCTHEAEVRTNPEMLRPLTKDMLLELLGRRAM